MKNPFIINSNQTITGTTSIIVDNNILKKFRKEQLMNEFEQNPELFSEIIFELRKRKIKQLKEKFKK